MGDMWSLVTSTLADAAKASRYADYYKQKIQAPATKTGPWGNTYYDQGKKNLDGTEQFALGQKPADYEAALKEAQQNALDTYNRRKPRGPNDAPPTAFDQAVQQAQAQALLGAQVGRTRAATFATTAQPLLSTAVLLGGI